VVILGDAPYPPYTSLGEWADAYGLDLPRASKISRGKLFPPQWVLRTMVEMDGVPEELVQEATSKGAQAVAELIQTRLL
jgi:hypothetical protein